MREEVGRLTLDLVPGQERCLVHTSGSAPRFFIVDARSDVWQALPQHNWWVWAPGLNLAIGVGDKTSYLYAIDGVTAL